MRILFGQYEFSKSSKNIYGYLCINHDEKYFPDHEWTDFLYPVFVWWADSFITAYKNNSEIKMPFMDGEFCMQGIIDGTNMIISCYNSYVCEGHIFDSFCCKVVEFRNELIYAIKECKNIFEGEGEISLANECATKINLLSKMILI